MYTISTDIITAKNKSIISSPTIVPYEVVCGEKESKTEKTKRREKFMAPCSKKPESERY